MSKDLSKTISSKVTNVDKENKDDHVVVQIIVRTLKKLSDITDSENVFEEIYPRTLCYDPRNVSEEIEETELRLYAEDQIQNLPRRPRLNKKIKNF